jgi:anti-sigma factor RsiW
VSAPPEPVGEADLHAHADGRLPPERRAIVAEWLAHHPEAREHAALWRRQNELIRELHGEPLGPLPARLQPSTWALGRRQALGRLAMAVAAGLLAGGGAGWIARGLVPPPDAEGHDLAREAARAHRDLAEAPPLEAGSDGQTRLLARLAQELGHPVHVPDLSGVSLHLLGGRTVMDDRNRKAVQLVYEDPAGARFTLYLLWADRPAPPEFRFFGSGEVNLFYWPEDALRCVLVGPADPDHLLDLALAAYDEMEKGRHTATNHTTTP